MHNLNQPEIDPLQVTQVVVVILPSPVGKTRALARVVINDQLQLTGLRIVDGSNGLFVGYPNDPSYKGGDYRSIFYPLSKELREHVEHVVLTEFNAKLLTLNQSKTGEST